MKKSKAAVILVAILAAFAGLAYYASIILSSTGIGEEMSIPLGLDPTDISPFPHHKGIWKL